MKFIFQQKNNSDKPKSEIAKIINKRNKSGTIAESKNLFTLYLKQNLINYTLYLKQNLINYTLYLKQSIIFAFR